MSSSLPGENRYLLIECLLVLTNKNKGGTAKQLFRPLDGGVFYIFKLSRIEEW